MNISELKEIWKKEEEIAHIHGWDFSHINDRFEAAKDLPWDYRGIIQQYLKDDMNILDYDTGGGEFLLSLNHPYHNTSATEGYPPNVELCKETLLPMGIDFKACDDPSNIPFPDESFDLILNRHGSFDAKELYRLLKKDGIFITEQVGGDNDMDLVRMVLPEAPIPFPDLLAPEQIKAFEDAGFQILQDADAYLPIKFFDMGAFVWFARIIEWEFKDFSVDACFDRLLELHKVIQEKGLIEGTAHRYLIVAKK